MKKILNMLCLSIVLIGANFSYATVILVENTLDSGTGSLRDAVSTASLTENDTILINTKGTIGLDNPINFTGISALTVIGPFPKHISITPNASCSGNLFNITGSGLITFKGIGFIGGNGATRYVRLSGCPDPITFENCLFEGNSMPSNNGSAFISISSEVVFKNCSFIDNVSRTGGAMQLGGSTNATLQNCTFSGNQGTNNAGAISIVGSCTASLYYCTIINNASSGSSEAVFATGATTVNIENVALGDNGTSRQIRLNGTVNNTGGNRIKQNSVGEATFSPINISDVTNTTLDFGFRSEILEDGFGLKYWLIENSSSDLINSATPSVNTPTLDCRGAPRDLMGGGALSYPDAGASEFTHLRVLNNSGDPGTSNSLLWCLKDDQRTDAISYIEFNLSFTPVDIAFQESGEVADGAYIIDGFSQTGSAIPGPHATATPGLTKAVIPINIFDGTGNTYGFEIESGAENSIIQGLRIRNFQNDGIRINGNQASIYGCEIGIDSGGGSSGNGNAGIEIASDNNIIGGWEHWQRNVVTGNGTSGALNQANISIISGNNSIIQGNIIGGNTDGVSVSGSTTEYGIRIGSQYIRIGGNLINEGNIIVGNEFGIWHNILGDFTGIYGNKIGIGWDELTALGNNEAGIYIEGGDDNYIGTSDLSYRNIIAHNGTGIALVSGVTVAVRNQILGNAIYSNTGQGIDFLNDGSVYPNDGLTSGSEQNNGLDFPIIVSSENCTGTETISMFELTVPTGGIDYRVEFYSNSSPDAMNGEGETYLGSKIVNVTSNPQTFTYDHGELLPIGTNITATVTQLTTNNTSEFGTNIEVSAGFIADASFSYETACPGLSITPTITGDTGGSFRFTDPTPADGSTLNSTTGEFANGQEGTTYKVIYNVGGVCSDEDTVDITVNTIDETFTYPDFCPESLGSPSSIATLGGEFTLFPEPLDGASITLDGGILSGGIEGTTYTVRYVVGDGTCTDTGFVNVLVTPTDESFTLSDFCAGTTSAPAIPATSGGTYTFDPVVLDGTTINTLSGVITGGVEGSSYTVKYEVGSCLESAEVVVSTIVTDESFNFDDFCPDAIGVPSDIITPGGTFSFVTDPGLPTVIDPGTGAVSFGEEGESYDIIYTVGACNDKDTAYPIIFNIEEHFTFPDFCPGEYSTTPVEGDPSGTFSYIDPSDGSSINALDGTIHYPVEGTTYSVTHSVTNLEGCTQTETQDVFAIEINEYFEYPIVCDGSIGAPSVITTPGGIFSIVAPGGGPATIDDGSGTLLGAVGGETYTIRYVVTDGTCFDSMDVDLTIIDPSAAFTFDDFCPGPESPAPTGFEPGGEFSFDPAPADAATIDPSTGVIYNPLEDGTYGIKYKINELGCLDSVTLSVDVFEVNEAFGYEDFCWDASSGDAEADVAGGTFTFGTPGPDAGDLVELDSDTGILTSAMEGATYEIIHTLTVGTCTQSDSTFVTALGVDESFTFPDYCPSPISPTPTVATSGGHFSFSPEPGDGATIDGTLGVIIGGIEGTSYEVIYTVPDITGFCTETAALTVSVISIDESFTTTDFCAEFASEAIIPVEPGGTFSFDPDPGDGALIDASTGIITSAIAGTDYPIKYTVGSCGESSTDLVKALASEDASFTFEDHCANILTAPEVTGNPGGLFNFSTLPGDLSEIDPVTGVITASMGGTYSVQYITLGSIETCKDTLINVVELFAVPFITALTSEKELYCPDDVVGTVDATGDGNTFEVLWYKNDSTSSSVETTYSFSPAPLDVGSNQYYAQAISSEGCLGFYEPYVIILSDTAGMKAIPDFDICLGSPAELEAYGGTSYEWKTDVPISDPLSSSPSAFSLTEKTYYVNILNNDGCKVIDSTQVGFLNRLDCNLAVHNAFSPNADGTNDFWYIDNLINFIPNTVYIYNRWGNEVYFVENYDNINNFWSGEDKSGNDLPPGTYFYVVITDDPNNSEAGWVQLVR